MEMETEMESHKGENPKTRMETKRKMKARRKLKVVFFFLFFYQIRIFFVGEHLILPNNMHDIASRNLIVFFFWKVIVALTLKNVKLNIVLKFRIVLELSVRMYIFNLSQVSAESRLCIERLVPLQKKKMYTNTLN